MNKPTFLFDIDGILLINNYRFSDRLAAAMDIPVERILPFFTNEFQACLVGKAELKTELEKYLPLWGWTAGVEQLLHFWLDAEANTNQVLLNEIQKLREQGIKCYAATNQESYRAEFIWNHLGLKNYLDKMFCSYELGVVKPDQGFYKALLERLNIEAEQIIYWDDSEVNVVAAQAVGIQAHVYQSLEQFMKVISSVF